jgi:dienelactone hydrolase
LKEALAIEPSTEIGLDPVLLERTEYTDHIRERVEIGTCYGMRVPVYVLIPKERPDKGPAVLALHGHGYGSREIVGLHPDGSDNRENPTIHGNYALEMVKRGFIVIAPEIIGFGDRRLAADQEGGQVGISSCNTITAHLLMYGIPIAGLRVHEALRALEYMRSRPEIDESRIGCAGFSGGGLIAAYAAALDRRIKAAVLWGFTNTFKISILAMHHCVDNYIPGVLRFAELPDLIGLIAPRALFVESGDNDPIFPVEGVRQALDKLREIYRQFNAETELRWDIFPGAHQVTGRKAYPWLRSKL